MNLASVVVRAGFGRSIGTCLLVPLVFLFSLISIVSSQSEFGEFSIEKPTIFGRSSSFLPSDRRSRSRRFVSDNVADKDKDIDSETSIKLSTRKTEDNQVDGENKAVNDEKTESSSTEKPDGSGIDEKVKGQEGESRGLGFLGRPTRKGKPVHIIPTKPVDRTTKAPKTTSTTTTTTKPTVITERPDIPSSAKPLITSTSPSPKPSTAARPANETTSTSTRPTTTSNAPIITLLDDCQPRITSKLLGPSDKPIVSINIQNQCRRTNMTQITIDSGPMKSMNRTITDPISVNRNETRRKNLIISSVKVMNQDALLLLKYNSTHYEPRDITYFLENHPAHSIHDPRAYFTSERTTRSLAILLHELDKIPEKLRFAYVVRVFNELGRKIASKLNYYALELTAVLIKTPDQLGNKPEVSMLVDAVNKAFESKEDGEIMKQEAIKLQSDNYVTSLIVQDKERKSILEATMAEISNRFANIITYFISKANSTIKFSNRGNSTEKMSSILGEAIKVGARDFILETSINDRFRIPLDVVGFTNLIINNTISVFSNNSRKLTAKDELDKVEKEFKYYDAVSFKDLNPISDKTGLVGSWNSYIFSNLGSSERVVKLFSSLMSRVPVQIKSRWINMYMTQVQRELEKTISGFVVMQGMPFNDKPSELFLLDPNRTIQMLPNKAPTIRDNYSADKNRIPARCYLAGRRWRMVLNRAMDKYPQRKEVITNLANKVGTIKVKLMDLNGNDIYKLCLPRLEVGIRGWTIDGNPEESGSSTSDKFPLKNPIEKLSEMEDPFVNGVKLGFGLGVRVGYNEERNATLEMERTGRYNGNRFDSKFSVREKLIDDVEYVAMASYRKAATVGAKKAFEISVRQGYLETLKVSVRSGMIIPTEAASRISALKSVSFAGQLGQEVGKTVARSFIDERQLSEYVKKSLIKVGQTHGLLAGETMGETIGAIVGKAAAEEAYRRSIIRGGKVSRAKFHLEEFEAGAKLGFDYGINEGKRIASSTNLDPSAPRFFRFHKPAFTDQEKDAAEADHWEKDLIPPVKRSIIEQLAAARGHTPVRGSLKGTYKVAKEVKKGFKRLSFSNVTYDLDVNAEGFIKDNIAYLVLNGTVNKMGILRGSLIARDIFNDEKDS